MSAKFKIKKNDVVVVISGVHRGKRGKVLQVLRKKNRAVVEGVNMIKKHVRKTQKNPQGGIETREGTIHVSNLVRADVYDMRKKRKTV